MQDEAQICRCGSPCLDLLLRLSYTKHPFSHMKLKLSRWLPDDLGIPSFARLGELRKLPVADYDSRFDTWVITASLSEGCGGPELPEEIML